MYQFSVYDSSQISEARRLLSGICQRRGLKETELAKIELVVTEMATNLIKHANGGEVVATFVQRQDGWYLELLSLDLGPGIQNLGESLQDGYSTAGSPGTGLGAIKRLSSFFDIYSIPGRGTTILSILPVKTKSFQTSHPSIAGSLCLALKGEEACGDRYALHLERERLLLLVVDGLGHGLLAAQVALEAVNSFHENLKSSPKEILQSIHGTLKGSRGAAMASAEILPEKNQVCFCGIGNIAGRIVPLKKDEKRMVSYYGTVGVEVRRFKEYLSSFYQDDLFIMHSDGLSARWTRDDYPGLWLRHPTMIAGTIYREHRREEDDSCILVVKGKDLV